MKNREDFVFLPHPRGLTWEDGTLSLEDNRLIVLNADDTQALHFTGRRFQEALSERFDLSWELVGSTFVPAEKVGLTLTILPEAIPHSEGYRLTVRPTDIEIQAHDAAGAFYGVCTLLQLLEQLEDHVVPSLRIEDWPDFPARGVMLDISRDKVYKMETLFELVDRLASWKINELQLYTEHTFAYQQHPVVWAEASPMTAEQIMELDAYCRDRFIELVPNQNSFGHMHHWLEHEQYEHLAENLGEFPVPWGGTRKGPFSLAPTEPGSLELMRGLYDELLPNFSSRTLNVGCDETWDLGSGKSKAACEEKGTVRVYLDFLMKIYHEVKRRGYTMQFWGDIVIQHPEVVPELPKDAVALEWGYLADDPFDEHCAQYAAAGVPFYVCPGTFSWCSIAGLTDNVLGNLRNAAVNGLKHGAAGYLNTDWGDRGHWQQLPASFLGFVMGAAYSWNAVTAEEIDVPEAISRFAFDDPTGIMGRVTYDLGNVYQVPGYVPRWGNILFYILQDPQADEDVHEFEVADFERTLDAIDDAMAPLDDAQMERPDAGLVKREFKMMAWMLRHACKVAILRRTDDEERAAALRAELADDLEAMLEAYEDLWLRRNRPGGLKDSLAHFDKLRAVYNEE